MLRHIMQIAIKAKSRKTVEPWCRFLPWVDIGNAKISPWPGNSGSVSTPKEAIKASRRVAVAKGPDGQLVEDEEQEEDEEGSRDEEDSSKEAGNDVESEPLDDNAGVEKVSEAAIPVCKSAAAQLEEYKGKTYEIGFDVEVKLPWQRVRNARGQQLKSQETFAWMAKVMSSRVCGQMACDAM